MSSQDLPSGSAIDARFSGVGSWRMVGSSSAVLFRRRPSPPMPRSAAPRTVISHFPSRAHAEELVPTLAMIIVVRRSGHRKKFTEPVALSSTQPADLPLPRRAFRLSFDLLALRARCVEEPMGEARLGQAPANRIAAVCALLRVEKLCVERVPSISGIAERVRSVPEHVDREPPALTLTPPIHPLETTSGPDAGVVAGSRPARSTVESTATAGFHRIESGRA